MRGIEFEGVDWIQQAQDKCHCQTFVNMVMNLQFCKRKEFLDWLNSY